MHPRLTVWEKIRGKQPPFFGTIEDNFHAMKINPPESSPYAESGMFVFFVIFTKVGVGDYGKNIIKNVHIRFQFEKNSSKIPDMEIVSISPTGNSRIVGTIKGTKESTTGYTMETGAKAEATISGMVFATVAGAAGGSITKKSSSEEIRTYEYPNYIQIAASSGVGNYAIWDFKQGEGTA